jgi:murein DD-endopeptidase MepM/ murein hydrolase activator NlpD
VLSLLVGALVWTVSWSVASHVEGRPSPVAPEWGGVGAAIQPATADPADPSIGPSIGPSTGSTTDRTTDNTTDHRTGNGPPGARTQSEPDREPTGAEPATHALNAELLKARRAARIEQAQRADQELAEFIESVGDLGMLESWVPPISDDYRVTAEFGQSGSLWSNDHTGVDLAAPSGTAVRSVAAGTVTHVGDAGAYGLRVEVIHAEGTESSYSHLSRTDVVVGQVVQQGAVVGAVGSTGNSTGPHLHLELRPTGGVAVDPVDALLARGVVL